ncbi:MAG TPA: 6-pyruvoyl-tetrahydropterin synthase-related protein [Pyrinomonadaceae bacterium]|jgi:hypothetical protein|nr:6-pyruvoyl-tetrahydropterin synthase-related protein [Pyrinomonadaceae bacterium]
MLRLTKLLRVLAIALGGLLPTTPMWLRGMPDAGDAVFHAMWYTNFARQFFAGELYPRWLSEMNGGLGSPAFFFYAPLPYYLTLLFTPFLPSGAYGLRHLGASASLAVVASGFAAYLWLRKITDENSAAIASVLYMWMPYHLGIDLYGRVAFAELWAFVWMPLILYCVALIQSGRAQFAVAGLALSYAALISTHLPTVLIFSLIPPLVALCTTETAQRRRATIFTVAGMSLGIGLAAVYLIPAMLTQDYVSLPDMQASRYGERWLQFPRFSLRDMESQLAWATLTTCGLLACALVLMHGDKASNALQDKMRAELQDRVRDARRREKIFWLAAASASVLLMTPAGNFVWQLFTPLQSIQFPWRFNSTLCLAATMLAARALHAQRGQPRRAFKVATLAAACLLVSGWAAFTIWRAAPAMHMGRGALGNLSRKRLSESRDAPEYRPAHAASTQEVAFAELLERICKTGERRARVCTVEGTASFGVERWTPREIALGVETAQGVAFNVNQFYYPGWTAYVDGRAHTLAPSQPDGLLHLALPPGAHRLILRLEKTPQETTGQLVSAASVVLLLVWLAGAKWFARRPPASEM